MLLHKNRSFSIFFGDVQEQFIPAQFQKKSSQQLLEEEPFKKLHNSMQIKNLVFLHQVHGNQGIALQTEDQITALRTFDHDGDFLLTQLQQIGIGIASADCLPIILYDSLNHGIAIVHAGWRGTVAEIAIHALDQMCRDFNSNPNDITVFFGPSAKSCCYCIKDDLIEIVQNFEFANDVLITRGGKTFFDVPRFNQILLQKKGVLPESINIHYNICTLCNDSFCSVRRNPSEFRQMTVVSLSKIN